MRIFSIATILFSSTVFANPAVPLLPPVALPTNAKVVAGTAVISQTQTPTTAAMTVNQTSQRAVVNWDSFNVGKNASVTFNQPNANAVTLNRVTGATASMIEGAVKANGQVVFVNPNGVTFGKGAEINAAGVVATTMDISNKDFMDGKSTYKGNGKGSVVNEGKISTNIEGGYIALLAPEVRNDGYLLAKKGSGTVAMAAGEQITLDFKGNSLISVKVDIATYNALIENKRVVEVNGGLVVIAAGSANQLMASVIKNTGRISANSMVNNGGVIELVANTVTQAGKVTANSKTAEGGQINIVGNDITIASNSKTTATGATAGGQVNVGLAATAVSGGTQVNIPTQTQIKANADKAASTKQLAQTVTIEENALIDTSVTQTGNGGTIAIWSEVKTAVAGILKSMGGSLSGNGGFIETSSKGTVALAPTTQINTSANNQSGKAGTWLLDPQTLVIDSAAATLISNVLGASNIILDVQAAGCGGFGTCSNSGISSMTFLQGADIYSANPFTTLTLLAQDGTLNFNSNITAGSVYAVAQAINVNGSINSNGGPNSSIYLAGAVINILGNINSNGRSQNNTSSSSLNSANATTGANRRNGTSPLIADQNSYSSDGGLINILATGDINIGSGSYISVNGQSAGAINIVSTAGKVTVNGVVDALGKSANSGMVAIVGQTQTDLIGVLISSEGVGQGGVINLGQINNLSNGSTLAPPANGPPLLNSFVSSAVPVLNTNSSNSITTSSISIDGQASISAPNGSIVVFGDQIQVNNSNLSAVNGTIAIGREAYSSGALAGMTSVSNSTLIADRVETSGGQLGTSGAGVFAKEWLLDPNNVTIGATATSGGTLPSFTAGSTTSYVLVSDIQDAINTNGTSVTIIATGAITQSSALAFNYNGVSPISFTLDTRSGTAQDITVSAATTQIGSGTINLNYYASGNLNLSSHITSTNGKLNILGQSFYANNTFSGAGSGSNIFAGITSNAVVNFKTRGGYIVLDGTGGTITGLGTSSIAVAMGTIQNGVVWTNTNLKINTTNDGLAVSSATVGGGNFILSTSRNSNDSNGYGAWEPGSSQTIDVGGTVLVNVRALGVTGLSYTVGGYATTSYISALGDITMNASGNQSAASGPAIRIDSPFTSYAGSVNLNATTVTASNSILLNGAISGVAGVNLTASGGTSIGISSTATGDITSTAGTVNITSNNSSTVYGVSLVGSITAPKVAITANNYNATGKGVSVTGGITISALNGGVTNTYATAGDALKIQSTVGTTGIAGGINITTTAITNNSNGGNVSFISNGDITATAAVSFATANTTNHSQTITYDTRTGNQTSQITTGAFTYNATNASQKVNYVEESNGSPLAVGGTAVSGYINVDNTCPSCATPLTPASTATNITTSSGITVSGALNSGDYIYLNGLNNSASVAAVALGANTLTVTSASTAATAISVIGMHNSANKGNTGITSTGAITDNANGGGILFQSNADISQAGAVTVAANTSGAASAITYDTSSGTYSSTITAGALTLTGGVSASNTAINFIEKTAGAAISNSGLSMPGYIYLDNTFGCTGASCTPLSGYLKSTNSTVSNTTSSAGITISGALSAGSYAGTTGITLNGVSTSGLGVSITASTSTLTATTGPVNITGQSVSNWGIWLSSNVTSSAAGINLLGINAGGINAVGLYLAGTSNLYATNPTNGNIYLSGTVAGSGNNNNTTAAVRFDGNSTGQQIIAGNTLNISGYASGDNNGVVVGYAYPTLLKSGGSLTISGYAAVPGHNIYEAIDLNNAPMNSGSTLTMEGAVLSTINNIPNVSSGVLGTAANSAGYYCAICSAAITPVTYSGVSYSNYSAVGNIWIAGVTTYLASGGPSGVVLVAPVQSSAGNITIIGESGGNTYGSAASGIRLTQNVIAAGSVTLQGTTYSGGADDGFGIFISPTASNMVISAGTTLNLYGVSSSNNYISAAIGFYGAGTALLLSGGNMTLAGSSTNNSAAIYSGGGGVVMSSGGTLIMEGATTQTLTNANGGSGSSIATVAVGVANSSATSANGTSTFGGVYLVAPTAMSYGGNTYSQITAVGNINISGTAGSTAVGVNIAEPITSTAGAVSIAGNATTSSAVVDTSLITANAITVNGTNSGAATTVVSLGAMTINSCSTGCSASNITVTGTDGSAGGNTGITQTGAINQQANGGAISFTSNNSINQTGAVTVAANTSGAASAITYDTSSGTYLSTITNGALTLTGGVAASSKAINFIEKTAGAAISNSGLSMPGYIYLDNTFGCSGANCTPLTGYLNSTTITTTNTTSSTGVAVTGGLTSGSYAGSVGVTVKGVTSTGGYGVSLAGSMTATTGDVVVKGVSVTGSGVYLNGAAPILASAGNINISAVNSATNGTNAFYIRGLYSTAQTINASGNVDIASITPMLNINGSAIATEGYTAILAGGNITLSADGGGANSKVNYGAVYTVNTVFGAGGHFTIQDAVLGGGFAVGSAGTPAKTASTGFYFNPDWSYVGTGLNAGTYSGIKTGTGIDIVINSTTAYSDNIQIKSQTATNSLTATTGDINIIGNLTGSSAGAAGVYISELASKAISFTATAGNITISGASNSTTAQGNNGGYGATIIGSNNISIVAGQNVNLTGISSISNAYAGYGLQIDGVNITSGAATTLSGKYSSISSGSWSAVQFTNSTANTTGAFVVQGATLGTLDGLANAGVGAPNTAAASLNASGGYGFAMSAPGAGQAVITSAGGVNINASSASTKYGVYDSVGNIVNTGGLLSITGVGAGSSGVYTASGNTTMSSNSGIYIYANGGGLSDTAGNIGSLVLGSTVTNTGTTGTGVVILSTANTTTSGVSNSGNNGMQITGGSGIAAGTITGGSIIALGTLTNTGGYISLSTSQPQSSNGTASSSTDYIANVINIYQSPTGSQVQASTSTNVSYNNIGGVMSAPSKATMNNINYRMTLVPRAISISLANTYSQVYGTLYNSTTATNWLDNVSGTNTTISSVSGSGGGFGAGGSSSTPSNADVLASLRFSSTIGGNSNNVQNATSLVGSTTAVTSSYGVVTVSAGTYTITKAPLTITGTKVYDTNGNFTYANMSVSGAISGETIALTAGTAIASSSGVNVGTYSGSALSSIAISVTGGNALASNYSLPPNGTMTITAAPLTITANSASKTYGQVLTYGAGSTAFTQVGLVGGQTIGTVAITDTNTGGIATAAVSGSYALTPSAATGGTFNASNYNINYVAGLLTINRAPLTITANADTKVYGATKTYGSGSVAFTSSGLITGQSISSVTITDTNSGGLVGAAAGGTYALTPSLPVGSGGFNTANYTITYTPNVLTVTKAPLTITGTKVYNANGSFTYSDMSISGGVNGETVSLTAGSATSSGSGVGTYAGSSLSGLAIGVSGGNTSASNYSLPTTGTMTITAAPLTIQAIADTKTYGSSTTTAGVVYNGTTSGVSLNSVNALGYTVSGLFSGDTVSGVTLTSSGGAVAANASGTPYSVTPSAASGTGLGNYTIGYVNGGLTVNPAVLVITNPTMVYNGTTTFTPGASGVTYTATGVNGQTVVLGGSGTLTNGNVQGGSAMNSTSSLNIASVSAGLTSNYVLPASLPVVTITPAPITVTLASQTKTYDSTTGAVLTAGTSSSSTGSYTISGFVSGQGAYITQTVGSYNSANASSSGLSSVASSVSAALPSTVWTVNSGTNLSNYTLPTTVSATGTINKAALSLTANDVTTFIGVTPAPSSLVYSVSGLVGTDTNATAFTAGPSVTNTGSIAAAGVTAGAIAVSGTAPNYTITPHNGTLTVVGNYQLVVAVGNSSNVFGTYNQTAVTNGTVGSQATGVTAGYCTNCGVGVSSPTIISLTVTAPSTPSGLWTAADNLTNQGKYNFAVTPSISSFSNSGSYVNVGNYALTPNSVTTVAGYATNYDVSKSIIYTSGTLTVTPLTLTYAPATPTITYNGSTAINSVPLTPNNLPAGMSGVVVNGSGAFTSPNASNAAGYAITNAAITGPDAANFAFSSAAAGTTGTTGVISPAAITVSASNTVKTYDTTTSTSSASVATAPTPVLVSGTLYTNSVTGLADTLASVSTVYYDSNPANAPNVGSGNKTVQVSNAAITNGTTNASSNYTITYQNNTTSTINPAPIVINGTGTYNGTTNATTLTATGLNGQTLVISGGTGTMNSANAGTNTLTGMAGTLLLANGTGSNAGLASNYTVVNPSLGTVVIAPAAITVSASNTVKTYDVTLATSGASVTTLPTPTLVSGTLYTNSGTSVQDSLSGGTYAYLDPNAGSGNKSVSVSGVNVLNGSTNVNSNYTITYVNNTTSTINPATIVISGTGTYNGTNALSSFTATGVNGQTLIINGATGTMSSANAGTNAITGISGGTLAGGGSNPGNPANYTIVSPTFGNAVISPVAITVTASDTVKTYDATTATSGTNVSSTPAPVLLSGTLYTVSGVQDSLSGGTYAYVDPNVKNVDGTTNKTVTVSNVAVSNGSNTVTPNYTITYVNNTTSTINPARLTVSGLTNAGSTPYNGTTAIAIGGTPTLSGIISGAPVVISGGSVTGGTLASPNAANGVVVTPDLSSLTLNNPNYVIVGPTAPMSTNITPLQLTATIIGSPSMQYNGTTTNSGLTGFNYTLTGFISGQGGAVSQPTANYNSADVSSATSITAALTPANITANSGTLLSNYILPTSATGAGSITPAPLTMTANNASTFLGVAPSLSGSGAYTLMGLKGSDTEATAISGAAVTNVASSSNPGAYTNALVPSATSSNYTLTFVPGNLTIAGADQIVIAVSSGNNTVTYGTYGSGNVATAGNALSASNISAQYCTNCVANMGGTTPNIISLTITAPSGGSNLWTAADNISPNTSAQGVYNFTITPTVPAGSYSSGNYLKVGSYAMTPGDLTTVTGYSTNYNQSKPVVYTAGTLTVTPLTINLATGPSTTYNGTTTINGAAVTPSNLLPGDVLAVAANGTLTSPNANAGGAGYSLTSAVLSGADAANYVFSSGAPSSNGTNATVLRAPIRISASNTVKTYDKTTSTSSTSVTTAPTTVIVSGTLYANTTTGFTDTLASVSTDYASPNVAGANASTVNVSNAAITNNGNSANSNYVITYVNNTTSTINPAPLTVSGLTTPDSQTYNNNSAVAISGTPTLSGLLPGTTASISGATVTSGTAASVNAGSNIAVTPDLTALINALAISNPNYVIVGPTTPLSVNITPAPLTISGLTAAGIVYNGGTATTVSGTPVLNGAISGAPAVVIGSGSVTSGTFVSPNASTSTVVDPNLSSLVLSGPGASNYTIVGTTSPLTAPITPAPLTVTLVAQTKQYDSTVDATLTSASYTLSGFVSGQGASITQAAGVYNSPNVVGAVSVTAALSPSNFTANTGTLLSNYILPTSATGPGTITPAPLTMTANNVTTFIGVAPNLAGVYTLTGLLGADTAATAISNPVVTNTSNATGSGTYAGALVPSATSSNYTLSYVSGALNIASNMQLVINVGTNSVVFGTYNQAQVVAGTAAAQMPIAPSYSANGVSASYCTNCAVGNLNPTYVTLTVTAPTSGTTWTAVDSVGTGASQGLYTFTISPTVPVGSYSTGSYLKVGNYAMTASGVATVAGRSTNYNPSLPVLYTAGSLTVTPLVLQFSSPYPAGGSTTSGSLVPNMQYNGTTNVNNAVLTPSNLPTGMSLSVLGNGSYASPNASTSIPVSITSAILSGADAANFTFAGPVAGTGVITPAPITVSATNAIKTYDNTLSASGSNVSTLPTPTLVSGTLYSVNGVQDALSGGTYAYLNPNAGSGNKAITVSSVAVKNAGNTISSNYTITYVNNTTSTINPAVLTISGLSATSKTYDTTNVAVVTGTPTLAGNPFGASVTLSGAVNAGLFATSNAGNSINVSPNLSSLVLNNPNFVIGGLTTPLVANIAPAPVTISGLVAHNKVYTSTTAAVISGTPIVIGLLGSDTSTVTGSVVGTFISPNVANGINVSANLSGMTLSNGNYVITALTTQLAANITPAPVTISGLVSQDKIYDGSAIAFITGTPIINGLLGSDISTVYGAITRGNFVDSNTGVWIMVNADLSSLSLSNPNYYIAGFTVPLKANISKAIEIKPTSKTVDLDYFVHTLLVERAITILDAYKSFAAYSPTEAKKEAIIIRDINQESSSYLDKLTIPSSGSLAFRVPNKTVQELIDLTGANKGLSASKEIYNFLYLEEGTTLEVSSKDGEPLPNGVSYSPFSRSISVANLTAVQLPLTIKVSIKREGIVLGEKYIEITKTNL